MKHTEDTKIKMSAKRKEWLKSNPDKHPWRKKSKFTSIPCEQLKEVLKENKISFEEEVLVSDERHYSVDILIPNKNLILEVNGNQHYNKDGSLKEYYENRHNHIKKLGWNIIELHYSTSYNHKLVLDIINSNSIASKILPFRFAKDKLIKKYNTFDDYIKDKRLKNENNNIDKINKVISSDIDFSKYGWVNNVAKLVDITPQKTRKWIKRYMLDFYINAKPFERL